MQLNQGISGEWASPDLSASRRRATNRYYELHAEDYSRTAATFDTTDAINRFSALLSANARVLDVGCGSGRDLVLLRDAGHLPTGLDSSAALVGIARAASGLPVIQGDLRRTRFQDATFDGIWAMASLLHLERDETVSALEEMARLLVPGGILFASVKRGAGRMSDAHGRWFTLHDETAWALSLEAAGFEVIEIVGEPPAGPAGSTAPGWISSLARAL